MDLNRGDELRPFCGLQELQTHLRWEIEDLRDNIWSVLTLQESATIIDIRIQIVPKLY